MKKGGLFGCCLGCLVVVLLLVGGTTVAAGYFGLIPSISKILGTNKAKDLGIRYANIDVVKLNERLGSKLVLIKSDSSSGLGFLLEGQKFVDYNLTSEEISALAASPVKFFPFQEVQIKIGQDGTLEASGILRADKIISFAQSLGFSSEDVQQAMNDYKIPVSSLPIYAKGTLSVTNNKVDLALNSLEVGRIGVPQSLVEKITPTIVSATEAIIQTLPGVDITSMTFDKGLMNYKGTIPTKQTIQTE